MSINDDGISVKDKKVVKPSELVMVQGIIQAMQAEREAPHYFRQIDSLARELFKKVFEDENSG